VMSVSVCLSVCVFAREHISGTTHPILNFLCMLTMAVARFSPDGVVILVLWVTSYCHIMGEVEAGRYRCSE